jgi:hypothetical protein
MEEASTSGQCEGTTPLQLVRNPRWRGKPIVGRCFAPRASMKSQLNPRKRLANLEWECALLNSGYQPSDGIMVAVVLKANFRFKKRGVIPSTTDEEGSPPRP